MTHTIVVQMTAVNNLHLQLGLGKPDQFFFAIIHSIQICSKMFHLKIKLEPTPLYTE